MLNSLLSSTAIVPSPVPLTQSSLYVKVEEVRVSVGVTLTPLAFVIWRAATRFCPPGTVSSSAILSSLMICMDLSLSGEPVTFVVTVVCGGGPAVCVRVSVAPAASI